MIGDVREHRRAAFSDPNHLRLALAHTEVDDNQVVTKGDGVYDCGKVEIVRDHLAGARVPNLHASDGKEVGQDQIVPGIGNRQGAAKIDRGKVEPLDTQQLTGCAIVLVQRKQIAHEDRLPVNPLLDGDPRGHGQATRNHRLNTAVGHDHRHEAIAVAGNEQGTCGRESDAVRSERKFRIGRMDAGGGIHALHGETGALEHVEHAVRPELDVERPGDVVGYGLCGQRHHADVDLHHLCLRHQRAVHQAVRPELRILEPAEALGDQLGRLDKRRVDLVQRVGVPGFGHEHSSLC